MQESEYNQIEYFQKLSNYKPDDRFLKYRLNIIIITGMILFYYISEFEPTSTTMYIIQGKIHKTGAIKLFLILCLTYNVCMFTLIVYSSVEKFKLIYNFTSFYAEVAKYQFLKKISISPSIFFGPNFTFPSRIFSFSKLNENEAKISVSKYEISKLGGKFDNLTGADVEITSHSLSLTFYVNDNDRKEFQNRKKFHAFATSLNWADIYLPYFLVLLCIFFSIYYEFFHPYFVFFGLYRN